MPPPRSYSSRSSDHFCNCDVISRRGRDEVAILPATPKSYEEGSEVEWVDDIPGYGQNFPAQEVEPALVDGRMRKAYSWTVKRKFHVTLIEHDEGVSVSCPELPGCHSQGANVDEALQNIQDAIREYLEVYGEPETRCEIREMEVVTA